MTISIKYTERFKKTIKALNDTSNILKSSIQMVSDTVIDFRNKYPDDINNSSSNVFKDELSKVIFSIRDYPLISALYYTEGTSIHTIFDQGLYSDCIKLISRIVEDSKWHKVFIKKWLNEAIYNYTGKSFRKVTNRYKDIECHYFEYDIDALTVSISQNAKGNTCYTIYPTIILREYNGNSILHELTIGYDFKRIPSEINYKWYNKL